MTDYYIIVTRQMVMNLFHRNQTLKMTVQKAINLNGPKLFCLNPETFSRGLTIIDIGMSKLTLVTLTKIAIH